MPDGTNSVPVSIRLPADVIETLDKVAAALERLRSGLINGCSRSQTAQCEITYNIIGPFTA